MSEAAEYSDEVISTIQTDEQLMVVFSRGSTEAFSELFSRYKQPVFGFFRRRVPDPAQAEELAQETYPFLGSSQLSSRPVVGRWRGKQVTQGEYHRTSRGPRRSDDPRKRTFRQ